MLRPLLDVLYILDFAIKRLSCTNFALSDFLHLGHYLGTLSQYNLTMTDPAETAAVRSAIQAQGKRIHDHDKLLSELAGGVQDLQACHDAFQSSVLQQLQALSLQNQQLLSQLGLAATSNNPVTPEAVLQPAATPIDPRHEPRTPSIERYDGSPGTCRSFLTLCSLTFELQPSSFTSERSRVAYIITNLAGRAREWATAEWERRSDVCQTVEAFTNALKTVFDCSTPGREAARQLLTLKQGQTRVADHAIRFRTLAADSEWNASSLCDTFLHSLTDEMKDHLAPLDLPADFDSLVALAVKVDNRLYERRREKTRSFKRLPEHWGQLTPHVNQVSNISHDSPSTVPVNSEEPMQVGRTHLTPEERQRRQREGRCIYCGQLGHFLASCPAKGRAHQ